MPLQDKTQPPPSLTSLHGSQLLAQRGSTLRFARFVSLVPHAVLRGRGWGSECYRVCVHSCGGHSTQQHGTKPQWPSRNC